MHELSIAGAMVEVALRHARGRRVAPVELRVGHLRQVVPSALEFAFELVAEGTPLEGAELRLEEVPAAGRCRSCGTDTPLPASRSSARAAPPTWRSTPERSSWWTRWSWRKNCRRAEGDMEATEAQGVEEVHILWISEGMSCDGDTVSITAATQPSIEDVLLGPSPACRRCTSTTRCFAHARRRGVPEALPPGAARRARRALRARDRGLDPEREHQRRRLLDVVRQRRGDRRSRSRSTGGSTGWPRRRGPSSRSGPAPPTAASTRWPATPPAAWGSPTTSAGSSARRRGVPIVNVPGCPVQPDNFMETLIWLLYQAAGLAPMIPLDEQLRPTWLFGKTVHEGCDRAGYYEQARLRRGLQLAQVPGEDRLLGPGRELQRAASAAGWAASAAARTWAASASAARCRASPTSSCRSWTSRPGGTLSSALIVGVYGPVIRKLRGITNTTVNKEPKWRHNRAELTTGYEPSARLTGRDWEERDDGGTRRDHARGRPARRHGVGPDHADRREPRHLHEDRLQQPRGRRVQEHVVDVPRLQRVHEGQGPARRALHHQPHLRHLRRQPRGLLAATRRTWPTASRRRRSASGSSTSARPPSTCSTTRSSRTTWCSWTSASRWSRRPTRACSRRPRRPTRAARGGPRLPHDRRHHALVQPVHGRDLPRGARDEPPHARDVLPDGGAPRAPLDALSRRRRHGGDADSCSPTT